MKVALVTDTHAGIRNDLECLRVYQNNFWENEFFPELKNRGIDQIIHLGDFFDKRQYLTLKTMENTKNVFQRLLKEYDTHMTILLGNHDVLYRNTNEVNSPENIFGSDPRVTIINTPTEIIDGKILMVPWINRENYDSSLEAIDKSDAPYCFGHFEIQGAEMHKGTTAQDGMSSSTFIKFRQVFSGHFHTQSERGNIKYLGSPFEMTWNDFNDERGWHIFDTETGELEYIPYKESMFFKVEYDSKDNAKSWIPYKPESCEGKFIKVIVTLKESHYDFDIWLKRIQSYVPQELLVFDNSIAIDGELFEMDSDEVSSETNLEIIERKIDSLSDDRHSLYEKEVIKKKMRRLYTEAEV